MASKYVQKILADFEELFDPKEFNCNILISELKNWKKSSGYFGLCCFVSEGNELLDIVFALDFERRFKEKEDFYYPFNNNDPNIFAFQGDTRKNRARMDFVNGVIKILEKHCG